MADLGALRTFVNNFREALDILDEAERIRATTEERKRDLVDVTSDWKDRQLQVDTLKASIPDLMAAKQKADTDVAMIQADAERRSSAIRASFDSAMAELDARFQKQKVQYAAQLDELDRQIKAKQDEAKAAEDRLIRAHGAIRDLAASVR